MARSCRCWPRCGPKIALPVSACVRVIRSEWKMWTAAATAVRCRTSVQQAAPLCGEVSMMPSWILAVAIPIAVLVLVPFIVAGFLRDVDAGTIRMVSWLNGSTVIYRGPGKSKEIPLLTTGTTISSKVINVDLDITDQTADLDENGTPQPIKVRVLASAIVSVGEADALIKTAANRFFSKSDADQLSTLTDLLS